MNPPLSAVPEIHQDIRGGTNISTSTSTSDILESQYLLLMLEETNVTVTGQQISEVTLDLPAGWSMVCGPDSTVQAAEVFPGFYQLVSWGGTGYLTATSFEPDKAYWALVHQETTVTLPP